MGDVIDFKSARERMADRRPEPAPRVSVDGTELIYDPKPGSVGVSFATDADGTAYFTVTAPADAVGPAMASAREALAASFGVDARSRQTLDALRDQLGAPTFDAFVTTFVQQHFFAQALLRTNALPFLAPDLLTSEPPVEGEDYTFQVETLLRPTCELSSYDPVEIALPVKRDVSSKDVTEYLSNMAEELATWEEDPSRDAVVEGDRVTLNLDSTTPDGREFKALSGRHIPYLVGSRTIGEDFDRALVGMKPRERSSFSVSVPVPTEDGSVGYQVVNVKAQIDQIQKRVPAKIDDAWVAQNMPEAQTLLGLRSRVRTLLEREAEAAYHDEMMSRTADELAKRLLDEPDERYVAKMRDELVAQFVENLQRSGIDYQQYIAQPGFDVEAWNRQMTEDAQAALRRGLALDALADHLDINLEEEDIAKVVAQTAPGHEQEALQGLLDSGQMPKMCEVALRVRANEWLVEHAKGAGLETTGLVIDGGAGRAASDRDGKDGGKGAGSKGDGPKLQLI